MKKDVYMMDRQELCEFLAGEMESYEDYYESTVAVSRLAEKVQQDLQDLIQADFAKEAPKMREMDAHVRCINAQIRAITQDLREEKMAVQTEREYLIEDVANQMHVNKWVAAKLLKTANLF